MYATILMAFGAAIILLLGVVHLFYTFRRIVVAPICYVTAPVLRYI